MSEISVVKLECDEERMNKEFRLAFQNAKKNSLNYADGGHESLLDLSIPRTPKSQQPCAVFGPSGWSSLSSESLCSHPQFAGQRSREPLRMSRTS